MNVLKLFQDGVKEAVAECSNPALPIKFVDTLFDPPNSQRYLEIVHISNNPSNMTWNDERTLRGFFRLFLHWPKDGSGPYEAMALIEEIALYFTKERWLGGLKVADVPDLGSSIDGGADLLYPATVRYHYTAN